MNGLSTGFNEFNIFEDFTSVVLEQASKLDKFNLFGKLNTDNPSSAHGIGTSVIGVGGFVVGADVFVVGADVFVVEADVIVVEADVFVVGAGVFVV